VRETCSEKSSPEAEQALVAAVELAIYDLFTAAAVKRK
jgi:hypothetical protein